MKYKKIKYINDSKRENIRKFSSKYKEPITNDRQTKGQT